MNLQEEFYYRIDNDKRFDNKKLGDDLIAIAKKHLSKQFDISGVRLSLPDADNYDYLRGFVDGYGGEEPHDVLPNGFNDINEVLDRMYELKGNEA